MKFKEIKPGMVIHCPKEEDAKALLEHLDELGHVWDNIRRDKIGNGTYYEMYKENTCYKISPLDKTVTYGELFYETQTGRAITEFSDLIEPDEPQMSAVEVLEWLKHAGTEKLHEVFGYDYAVSPFEGYTAKECLQKITTYEAAKKKPIELEWVNVARIIDEDTEKCVQKVKIVDGGRKLPTERALKEYRAHHEGNFYAIVERRCRDIYGGDVRGGGER